MTGKNVCAMSKRCAGKRADRGMMCAYHRAQDAVINAMAKEPAKGREVAQ